MKSLKKVVLLGVATTSIFSACSTKEQANYEPYKKHDSVETEKGEEETSNPTKFEKVDEEPAKDEKSQQVEESTKQDAEINDRRPYYKDAKANEDRVTGNVDRNSKPATKSSTKIPNDYCGHGHDETKELAHGCDKIIDEEAHQKHLQQQEREYEEQQREEAKKYQDEMTEEDKARILRQEKRWNTPSGGIGTTWQDEMKEMEGREGTQQ
ncbi:hypothetical protein ACIQ7P_13415 [Bacillus wiedmannii]|uniref:hypothetical protein n=1 Tax=Bacillus wiedmannii TaxID=1890302 RepID=UPI00381D5537